MNFDNLLALGNLAVGAASVITARNARRDQKKALKQEAAVQAKAHADAEAKRSHSAREVSWRARRARMRAGSGYFGAGLM